MIGGILGGAVRYRWLVLFLTAIAGVIGAWQLNRLPIDVTPDITNKQVQINTQAPALGPLDMERLVTFPVETGPIWGSTPSGRLGRACASRSETCWRMKYRFALSLKMTVT